MTSPSELTNERKSTHGDWMQQSQVANDLKKTVRVMGNWDNLAACHQESIDMILTKISRIVSGNPSEPDHWDDIAGYAFLGKGGHKTES